METESTSISSVSTPMRRERRKDLTWLQGYQGVFDRSNLDTDDQEWHKNGLSLSNSRDVDTYKSKCTSEVVPDQSLEGVRKIANLRENTYIVVFVVA